MLYFLSFFSLTTINSSISNSSPLSKSSPPPQEEVSLNQLLEYATQHSPILAVAETQISMAQTDVGTLSLMKDPKLNASLRAPTNAGSSAGPYDVQVQIQQQLIPMGKRHLLQNIADSRLNLAKASVKEVEWNLHVELHRLFISALLLEEYISQLEDLVALARFVRDNTQKQMNVGDISQLTLHMADLDLAESQKSLLHIQQQHSSTLSQIQYLTGWTEDLQLVGELPPVVDTIKLGSEGITAHPTLQAREKNLDARQAEQQYQKRNQLPSPSIGLNYEQDNISQNTLAGISVSMSIPLWNHNQRAVAQSTIATEQAKRYHAQTSAELENRLERELQALQRATSVISLYEQQISHPMKQNVTLLQHAYEIGEIDFLQVSRMQEKYFAVLQQYMQERQQYYQTAANVEGLIGTELWESTAYEP